jgi:RNA polymerase sigma-70 factor (ECF subfamily)
MELNDMARRLDEETVAVELREPQIRDPGSDGDRSKAGPNMRRVIEAIEALPAVEREAFNLVRIQGLTQPEAAGVAGCSKRTLQRRLSRSLVLLTQRLGDLRRPPHSPPDPDC